MADASRLLDREISTRHFDRRREIEETEKGGPSGKRADRSPIAE